MNTTLIQNVGALAIATGALTKGLDLIYAHDYIAGGIAVVVGIIVYVIYEKLPTTPTA